MPVFDLCCVQEVEEALLKQENKPAPSPADLLAAAAAATAELGRGSGGGSGGRSGSGNGSGDGLLVSAPAVLPSPLGRSSSGPDLDDLLSRAEAQGMHWPCP